MPRPGGLFVAGTDTGVGKTVVTAALAHALGAEGLDIAVCKPVQSGALVDDPVGDAALLCRLSGVSATPREICVYAFAAPLAPRVAAEEEGRTIDLQALVIRVRELERAADIVLVEGAGGLIVPLAPDLTVADLAVELGFAIVVVGRPGLGTVNHTALTVEAVRSRGLEVAGVVLNGPHDAVDGSVAANPGLIEEITGAPVIGRMPWLDGVLDAERVGEELGRAVDVRRLLGVARPSR